MRSSAIATALLLAACSAGTPASKTTQADKSPTAQSQPAASASDAAAQASSAVAGEINVGPKAAALAYVVAAHSPLLTEAQRQAISQDFNGAPLDAPPQVHTVEAERVSCRARVEGLGEGTQCSIVYGADTKDLVGEDANFLFKALETVGVEPESGMGHIERTITKLICTVDDSVAQGSSSTGDEINGFACRFSVDA